MIRLPQEFSECLRLLNDQQVEYLLIGGWAVGLYGHVRYTGDIDVWVAADQKNAERVLAALADFGIRGPDIVPSLITEKGNILRFGVVPMNDRDTDRVIWGNLRELLSSARDDDY
jgi:hypothetical protein